MKLLSIGILVASLMGCLVEDRHYVPFPKKVLSIHVDGGGAGIVRSDPEGLTCTAGTCSGEFTEGSDVTLTASATEGDFLGWVEACRGQSECTLTMDRDRSVAAWFGTPGMALWARQIGADDRDAGAKIVTDGNGDLIAVGAFRGTVMAGSELISAGGYDLYVVKLAGATGAVLWARRFGGASDDYIADVAVDGSNNVYVLGGFQGPVDFGSGPLTPTGPSAVFVLELDANGGFGWVRKIDGASLGASSIASNGTDVAIAGDYYGSMMVDATTFTSAGASDLFAIALAASTGATTWARSLGGPARDRALDVALDGSGNAVLTGTFEGTVNFGGGPLSAPVGAINGFLLKLASAGGSHLLSRFFGGTTISTGKAVAVDSTGNILVTGSFKDSVNLGCTGNLIASQAGMEDVFLVKYTQAGSCLWAKAFGGPAMMPTTSPIRAASAIAVNAAGEVAIAGAFCGTISFGGPSFSSASTCPGTNAFAARLAGDGTYLSSVRTGGVSGGTANGITQSVDGRIFVTGEFYGFADFGGNALTSNGANDAFIVGFAPL